MYEQDIINQRYDFERKIMDLITNGDVDGIKNLIEQVETQGDINSNLVKRIPNNPLRDRKNGLVIRNTFCRIAARHGGLPPLYIHHISEKYALKIEQATSIDYLLKGLSNNMMVEYAEAVQQFSSSPYSKLIKDVVSYISQHLTGTLNLNILSNTFHVHPSHLARKFKKETGMTVIQYINFHRVNHAKLLFQDGNTNILEVSQLVGFNSSSYFDRVFKSVTSQTPSEYLKENGIR